MYVRLCIPCLHISRPCNNCNTSVVCMSAGPSPIHAHTPLLHLCMNTWTDINVKHRSFGSLFFQTALFCIFCVGWKSRQNSSERIFCVRLLGYIDSSYVLFKHNMIWQLILVKIMIFLLIIRVKYSY